MKKNLKNSIKKRMIEAGFKFLSGEYFNPSWGLYYKIIGKYCLTVGIETKKQVYPGFIGVTFYISKLPSWSSVSFMPDRIYQPVAFFLTPEERDRLLPEQFRKKGMIAGEWDIQNEEDIDKLIESISISEGRFLKQDNLMVELDKCDKIKRDVQSIRRMFECYEKKEFLNKNDYKFIPDKQHIPIEWYMVSEICCLEVDDDLNTKWVERWALLAFWQYTNPDLKALVEINE